MFLFFVYGLFIFQVYRASKSVGVESFTFAVQKIRPLTKASVTRSMPTCSGEYSTVKITPLNQNCGRAHRKSHASSPAQSR
jgi:hypothetical protein